MRVRDIMTPSPHTLPADATLGEAVELMSGYRIRHLPVVENDRIIGIISDRDVKMALGPDAEDMSIDSMDTRLLDGPVDWFMSDGTVTIDHDAQVSEAADLFLKKKVGALPVMNNGKLVGIISVLDIVRVAVPVLRELH